MNRIFKSLVSVCLLVLCLAPRFSIAASNNILVIGDSISAAYGMDINEGWVALLQERVTAQGMTMNVINASISGDVSASGKSRISRLLATHQPRWVLIELGGNDGLRGLPIGHIKGNLRAMIEQSKKSGAQVLLIGMQILPNYGLRYAQAFQGVYTELADSENVPLVPFILEGVGGVPGLNQADGIHPNQQAQPILLDNVWSVLGPLIDY